MLPLHGATADPACSLARLQAGPSGSLAPERVEQAVKELWQQLEEQLHRVEASLPQEVELPG